MIYRKAVFIVTYKKEKNKILYFLLKRKLHWTGWEFPKGGIERKEDTKNAVARELKEETGQSPFKIKSYNVSGKYKYNKIYADRKGFFGQSFKLFSAEVKPKQKIILDKKEHSDYQWLDYDKAWSKLKWPNQRKSLMIVNKDLMKK